MSGVTHWIMNFGPKVGLLGGAIRTCCHTLNAWNGGTMAGTEANNPGGEALALYIFPEVLEKTH